MLIILILRLEKHCFFVVITLPYNMLYTRLYNILYCDLVLYNKKNILIKKNYLSFNSINLNL